jgi:hypothetical protein
VAEPEGLGLLVELLEGFGEALTEAVPTGADLVENVVGTSEAVYVGTSEAV